MMPHSLLSTGLLQLVVPFLPNVSKCRFAGVHKFLVLQLLALYHVHQDLLVLPQLTHKQYSRTPEGFS